MAQRERGGDANKTGARRRRTRIAVRIGLCACAAAFLAGGVIAGKALLENRRAHRAYSDLRRQAQASAYALSVSAAALTAPVETPAPEGGAAAQPMRASVMDFSALKGINGEIAAWLTCEGTAIDYPVLHADDNEFYLTHLYTGERNRKGALFADYRNTGLFTDRNTVIYGHNMKSGDMFHALSSYRAQDFFEAHPAMTLYTPGGDYTIELIAGTVEDGGNEFVQFDFGSDAAFLAYVDGVRARSTFTSDVVVEPTDRIVTLCTCSYERNNARYAVIGRLAAKD